MTVSKVNEKGLLGRKGDEKDLAKYNTEVRETQPSVKSSTNLFSGWNEPPMTGTSNRTVSLRLPSLKSQTMQFQSLDVVRRYREFLDQLSVVNDVSQNVHISQVGSSGNERASR